MTRHAVVAAHRVIERAFGGSETPLDWVERAVSRSARMVLDLGCGQGVLTRRLPGQCVVGIDPHASSLVAGEATKSVQFVESCLTQLPFAPESFDAVVSCLSLPDALTRIRVLKESARVLKPGGALAVVMPSIRPMGPAEVALVSRVAGFLHVPPLLPGEAEFTAKQALSAAGLTLLEDTRARFQFSIHTRDDATLLLDGLRQAPEPAYREAALDFLTQRGTDGGLEYPVPMRRIVALK